jgi:hypothetical protein
LSADLNKTRHVVLVSGATAFSLLGDQVLYAVLPVLYQDLGLTAVQAGILLSANQWIHLFTSELAHTNTVAGCAMCAARSLGLVLRALKHAFGRKSPAPTPRHRPAAHPACR